MLDDPERSLAAQVAAALIGGRTGRPLDLGDTQVIAATAGAARAIRRELARVGVLSPVFRMPMESLDPPGRRLASRIEREAAWATVLDPRQRGGFATLVPMAVDLRVAADRFGVAAQLCGVCDQLALAGCDPGSPETAMRLHEDTQRWEELAKLYARYTDVLAQCGIVDPNDARLRQAMDPVLPEGLRRVVVACVPDLPPLVRRHLEALMRAGVDVEVLVWSPAGQHAHLDEWGTPEVAWWRGHLPTIDDAWLVVENDPASEAGVLIDRACREGLGFECFSAAPESTVALSAELGRRGATGYVPDGRPLAQSEAAAILQGWSELRQSRRLRVLRSLLQRPTFAAWVMSHADATGDADAWLGACDRLIAERLCETVDAAADWLAHAPQPGSRDRDTRQRMQVLIDTMMRLLAAHDAGPREFLIDVHAASPDPQSGSWQARELAVMADILDAFAGSPLLTSLDGELAQAALRAGIRRARVFHAAPDDAVEVQGWLEAPWSAAALRIIAGCREGALPAGAHEDAFLPDAARKTLGIPSQDARFAREAYLLSCLTTSRARVLLGTSRFRTQGEPNRPSRLLFGCDDESLPARASRLLRPSLPAKRTAVRSDKRWALRLPASADDEAESISVTSFKSYLECPVRFFLKHRLRLTDFDPEAREINAGDFGSHIHQVLDWFGRDAAMKDADDPKDIGEFLDDALERVMLRGYGTQIPPVARVQMESMRARLHAMAVLQAEERTKGWSIIATEKRLSLNDPQPMAIGPLTLTGTIDRIEVNEAEGLLRILDYKTFGTAKKPRETHWRAPRESEPVEAAIFNVGDKEQAWSDLQLPLYRHMVPHLWPEHADKRIEVGYFLLPADPEETKIEPLALDDTLQKSAVACAEEIAQRVANGRFWPPATEVGYDSFGDWFGDESPDSCLCDASIQLLGGER